MIDLALLAGFSGLLVKSALFAVDSIVKFSRLIGMAEFATGFIIVAMATSTPEISVAIFSVQSDNVGITLGDIFGSNVTNILLIAGILFFMSPIRQIQKKTLRHLTPLLAIAATVPLLLLVLQQESRYLGIGLLAFFAFYIYKSLRSKNAKADTDTISNKDPLLAKPKGFSLAAKQFLLFAVGITLVVISAHFIVNSASSIAEATGIRQSILGATIVAFGTSLPELSVELVSVRRRHLDLALGDIVGSSVTNITLILGIVLTLSAVEINFGVLVTLISFAILVHVIMFVFLRTGQIKKCQSLILFAIYGLFLLATYGI